ncbi:MAG: patatin-like phospholipase family protein, partial [Woeseiaceae bacterium]
WYALRARHITDFNKLAIPSRAVTADLESGEMVVMERGNLGVAMRASSSIAGVFTPVQAEGRFLVDGGIVRNLPIDVVRGMGADIVIAVDVGTPLRVESGGLVGAAGQVLLMTTRRNADEQIKQLRDKDVLIQAALDDIGAMQFSRAAEAALIGEVAARRRASALARYRVSKDQYRAFIQTQRVAAPSPPQVDYIQIDNDSPVNPDAIKARMELKPGDVLDKQSLERDLERIYGTGDFEYVSFLLVEDEDLIGLIVETRGKSWGPNYLRFGLNLEDDFDGNNQFNIIADFTKRPVNRLGAEWKNQLSMGEFRGIRSEFYQPLAASGRWFVAPQLEIVESGDDLGQVETRTRTAIVDLGVNLGKTCCELRVGVVASDIDSSAEIGFLQPPIIEGDLGAYQVGFTYDLLDNIAFPRHGSIVGLGGFYARTDVNDSDFEYDRTRLDWAMAGSIRRHTLIGFASLGSSGTSTLPPFAEFALGGFLNLSGLKPNELRGQYFGVLRFIYYFRLKRLALGHALYLGGSLEAGNVWDNRDDIFDDNITAGSAFFGADTIVGPLYLAYGLAEDDRDAFYLVLGRLFRLD